MTCQSNRQRNRNRQGQSNRQGKRNRIGYVTAFVMIAMLVVSSMALGSLRNEVRDRRELTLRHQSLQTSLLLDAGVRRGLAMLRQRDEYPGETWTPQIDAPWMPHPQVTIQIDRSSDDGAIRMLVIAETGFDPDRGATGHAGRVRREHTVVVPPISPAPTQR